MATYDAFLPLLYPLVPNAPEPSAIIALRNACIDFCAGSFFLREPMDPIASTQNIGTYEIDTPTNTSLAFVLNLCFDDSPLHKRSMSEIASYFGRNWQTATGTPRMFLQLNPDEVTLVPMPDKTIVGAITGIIALVPTRTSTTVDDRLYAEYAEEIVHGAAAKMLAIPNQPFSDPKAALYYGRLFSADIVNARIRARAGFVDAPLIVRAQRR